MFVAMFWQDSSCSWLTRFPFRKRSGRQVRGCSGKQARKRRDIARAIEHRKLIAEKESSYEAAILPDSDPGRVAQLPQDHSTPQHKAVSPAGSLPPRPVAGRAVRRLQLAMPVENTTQALEPMQAQAFDEAASAASQSCPESPNSCSSQDRFQEYANQIRFSRYPMPPDAPRKDQYNPESESESAAESPLRQPPAKVFRRGELMYHKKFRGQLPITYVDTRLYEGGHDDYYEAYSPNDLRWVRRIHYLLDAHGIKRWQ